VHTSESLFLIVKDAQGNTYFDEFGPGWWTFTPSVQVGIEPTGLDSAYVSPGQSISTNINLTNLANANYPFTVEVTATTDQNAQIASNTFTNESFGTANSLVIPFSFTIPSGQSSFYLVTA
jgi:hypothetical protein